MESTKNRLDRILKGLQHALTVCNTEVGDITSQILVREEALNKLEIDVDALNEQYQSFQETLNALKQKNEVVEARIKSSQKEIDDLNLKISNLPNVRQDPEVQEMIDRYQASIQHHEDILAIAQQELTNDHQKQEDIKLIMERIMSDLNKKQPSQIDEAKTVEEIKQLRVSLAKLDDAQDQISILINSLDPNRIEGSGQSIILHESDAKKRKLDDHFVRTPQSGGSRATKRMRPNDYQTPRKRATRDLEANQTEDISTRDAVAVADSEFQIQGPALFAPFLPSTAAKLLSVVDGRFDSIEWYSQTTKIPMDEDINNVAGSWTTLLQTTSKHFYLQKYTSVFFGIESFRIIAIDPYALVHDSTTKCVPLATSSSFPQTKLLLDMVAILEEFEGYDYENIWALLSKDS